MPPTSPRTRKPGSAIGPRTPSAAPCVTASTVPAVTFIPCCPIRISPGQQMQDIAALYAFLMTRAPVHATRTPNQLPFPLDNRVLLAGWNILYLNPGPWHAGPSARRHLEPRRLSRRSHRPLRRLPYPAQRPRRRKIRPSAGWRRGRELVRAATASRITGATALDQEALAAYLRTGFDDAPRRRRRPDDRR